MGLDSVELLISFENYFSIQISDSQAEKIQTVQEMVDCVSRTLAISYPDTSLKETLFEKLKAILMQSGLADNSFSLSDKIFSILNPDDKESLIKLSERLNLQIPEPFREADTMVKKIFSLGWRSRYDWKMVTVDQFITAIYANNYKKTINPKSIKTTYEILIAIIGITSDKLGLDVYEVQPDKRFVHDFGID